MTRTLRGILWTELAGLIAGCAIAEGALAASPPAEAKLSPVSFGRLEEALIAAAAEAQPRSVEEDREFLGGIFASPDGTEFVYSAAAGRRGADELSVRLRAPAGFRLAAIWHTHGAPGAGRSLFSERDTALAERLGLPIYLATPQGGLRVYHPGGSKLSLAQARRRGVGWREGIALGSAVDPRAADEIACVADASTVGPTS